MFNREIRKTIREAIGRFEESLEDTSELEIMGWIEVAMTNNYTEGVLKLNRILEEKRDEQRDA